MMRRVPRTVLALALGSACIAARAEAGRVEFGPHIDFPLPIADVGNTELGLGGGFTVGARQDSWTSVGLDLAYHYWPASSEYKAAFDDFLRAASYQVINDSTWAFSTLQASLYFKLTAPLEGLVVPWISVGLGVYRLNYNLSGLTNVSNISYQSGYSGSVGVDFPTGGGTELGLDLSYQELWSREMEGSLGPTQRPAFSAWTVGVHLLFTR